MKRILLIKILLATLLWLVSTIFTPAFAWPEVDAMNMCNRPVQIIRVYQGAAKGWANRDNYIATYKRRIYAANCPQIRSTKRAFKRRIYRKLKRKNHRKRNHCRSCYKKAYRAGYQAASIRRSSRVSRKKRRLRHSAYRSHAAEVADCKRVDWANRANRARVIAAW